MRERGGERKVERERGRGRDREMRESRENDRWTD